MIHGCFQLKEFSSELMMECICIHIFVTLVASIMSCFTVVDDIHHLRYMKSSLESSLSSLCKSSSLSSSRALSILLAMYLSVSLLDSFFTAFLANVIFLLQTCAFPNNTLQFSHCLTNRTFDPLLRNVGADVSWLLVLIGELSSIFMPK